MRCFPGGLRERSRSREGSRARELEPEQPSEGGPHPGVDSLVRGGELRGAPTGHGDARARQLPPGALGADCGEGTLGTTWAAPELHVLYASPLDQRLPQIDIRSELDLVSEAWRQVQCSLRIRVGIATTRTLAKLLTLARSGGRVILHFSMHIVQTEDRGPGLVCENAHGGAHVVFRPHLEELLGDRPEGGGGRLDGLPLVFFNSCWSEEIAQLFVESGCRHVVATRGVVPDAAARTFAHQLYYALGSRQSILDSWESAVQVLRVDPCPKIAASADLFVLFGQRSAKSATLWGVHGDAASMSPQACELPPRAEDFIGRSGTMCEILSNFASCEGVASRRVCLVSGPEGIGKSACAVELAHFAAAPGRLFSGGVIFVSLRGRENPASVLETIADCIRAHVLPDTHAVAATPEYLDLPSQLWLAGQQLERRRGRRLLILDDGAGALRASPEVRQALGGLLERTRRLCLVAFARERLYESLGQCKCVNIVLPALGATEAARLFLRRVHRPLRAPDLDPAGAALAAPVGYGGAGAALAGDAALVGRLAAHPLLRQLGGNPGRVTASSQQVTPDLRSLFDLCGLRNLSGNVGSALVRAMSVDEGGPATACPYPISREMSVDDTST